MGEKRAGEPLMQSNNFGVFLLMFSVGEDRRLRRRHACGVHSSSRAREKNVQVLTWCYLSTFCCLC
jgi:hypothetical protein